MPHKSGEGSSIPGPRKGGRRELMPEKSPIAYMHTCHIHSKYILSCTHRIILIFETKRRKKKEKMN